MTGSEGHDQQGGRPKRIVMVAAVADNGVIGLDGDIPWSIPEDLRHFRTTTTGHTVVMGRRTYQSIGRPLPHRTNIVVTRQHDWADDGVFVAHTVAGAIALAQDFDGDIMIIGGAQIYELAMPVATHQILTEVHRSPDGDTAYPSFERDEWSETAREPRDGFDFVWLERING